MSETWRSRYKVWCQAQPPEGGNEYAALCRDCPGNVPNGEHWVCDSAGSKSEAWTICREHEDEHHVAPTETEEHGEDDIVERLNAVLEWIANREDLVEVDADLLLDIRARLRSQEPVGYGWDTKLGDAVREFVVWLKRNGYEHELTMWDIIRDRVGPPIGEDEEGQT